MLETGVSGGNGVMFEVEPSIVVFISGGFGLAPPHYWRLHVTQLGIEPMKVAGDPPPPGGVTVVALNAGEASVDLPNATVRVLLTRATALGQQHAAQHDAQQLLRGSTGLPNLKTDDGRAPGRPSSAAAGPRRLVTPPPLPSPCNPVHPWPTPAGHTRCIPSQLTARCGRAGTPMSPQFHFHDESCGNNDPSERLLSLPALQSLPRALGTTLFTLADVLRLSQMRRSTTLFISCTTYFTRTTSLAARCGDTASARTWCGCIASRQTLAALQTTSAACRQCHHPDPTDCCC